MSAQAGSNLNTVSMTPTQEVNIKNVESKIKGIPSVSAQAGSNLNTVSMTQTTKNNTGDESKIKGIPSVSAQAGSNLNTVSMTHTSKLKNIKEVPLQHRKKRIAAKFDVHEKQDVARDKSVLPEKGNIEQECVTVCQ